MTSLPDVTWLCVYVVGVCVAGAPDSEDGDFLSGEAEETYQWHSQNSCGQSSETVLQ